MALLAVPLSLLLSLATISPPSTILAAPSSLSAPSFPIETERWLAGLMTIIADYLGPRLPLLPSCFVTSSAHEPRVEEESEDDLEKDDSEDDS